MQAQVYEGYFENGQFYPVGKTVRTRKRMRAMLTVLGVADTSVSDATSDLEQYILEPDMTKTPILGRLNGHMEIPADFDEPLDEMKEYMW